MCERFKLNVIAERDSSAILFPTHCECWACTDCGPRVRSRWLARSAIAVSKRKKWEVLVCRDATECDNMTARVRRHGGLHVRIVNNGTIWLVHSALKDNRQYRADKSRWLSGKKVLAIITRLIDDPGTTAVSCSQNIPLPTNWKRKRGSTGWKMKAFTKMNVDGFNKRFVVLGIDKVIEESRMFQQKFVAPMLGLPSELYGVHCRPKEDQNRLGATTRATPAAPEPSWDDIGCREMVT